MNKYNINLWFVNPIVHDNPSDYNSLKIRPKNVYFCKPTQVIMIHNNDYKCCFKFLSRPILVFGLPKMGQMKSNTEYCLKMAF